LAAYLQARSDLSPNPDPAMANPNVLAPSAYGPMIVNINDRYITREIINDGYWSREDIKLLLSIIAYQLTTRDRITIYDVGANIGTHCLAMASLPPARVSIRAFEAQRQIFYMLCGNMALNGVRNVYCHHNAVSDVDNETIELIPPDYNRPNNFGGFELIEPLHSDNFDMTKAGSDTVRTVTIDAFGEDVGLIKMDIEGMEDRALNGARQTIATHRPIGFVEIAKTDSQFVLEYFRQQNYRGYLRKEDLIAIPAECKIDIGGLSRLF
jgi:FkbM family methyltransferase